MHLAIKWRVYIAYSILLFSFPPALPYTDSAIICILPDIKSRDSTVWLVLALVASFGK